MIALALTVASAANILQTATQKLRVHVNPKSGAKAFEAICTFKGEDSEDRIS